MLVKQQRELPPWFLGALESSMSLGAIVGALLTGRLLTKLPADRVIILGICLVGLGIAGMGFVPTVALPLLMMLLIGFGLAIVNIPISTSIALAVPDAYRSRLATIRQFLSMTASPVGVALSGPFIAAAGLIPALVGIGVLVLVLSPTMLLIPYFSAFFRATPEEARTFFSRHYPGAFAEPGAPVAAPEPML